MLRLIVLVILISTLVMAAVAIVLTLLSFVVLACAIGIPLYFMLRPHLQNGLGVLKRSPIERLQQLYVEGKIDLFEYERRVAYLLAHEQ